MPQEPAETALSRTSLVMESAIVAHTTPGLQYAVVRSTGIVISGAVGRFTYDADSTQVTPETVYDIASLTKVVAGTGMAMLLWQEGKLDLESPICEVVPELCEKHAKSDQIERKSITFRTLLAHTSGLPGYAPLYRKCKNRKELLDAARKLPLEADPGVRVEYSDIGFILLELAMERMAGEPIDAYVQRRLFTPLNMLKTGYLPSIESRKAIPPTDDGSGWRGRLIQGEVHDDNCFIMNGISAHAGLFSCANDIARFAQCLLRGGESIFNPLTIQQFTRKEAFPSSTTRTLGWDTPSRPSSCGKYFSFQSFGHLGYTGCSLWIDPLADLAIILLTNRVWPDSKPQGIKELRPRFHAAVREDLGFATTSK